MGKQKRSSSGSTGLALTGWPQRLSGFLSRFGLWLILALFIFLAVWYSLIVPITQGEDELAHYRYLSFIAQTGRLPLNQAERQQAWYRSDWPPLYHLLVGWAVSHLDTTQPHLKDVGESPRRRLVGEIFYPRLIIYTEDANWPWRDGILAWHLGRFISILFSAAALIFVYLTALELGRGSSEKSPLLPRSYLSPSKEDAPLLALAATALLAFNPRYLFTSAMLGDDSLFVLLSAVFIWLLLRAGRGSDQWWLYALMGLLLGLSITTKYSTGLLPLTLIPVVVWQVKRAGWSWGQAVGRLTIAWLSTLVAASWWFGWIGYHFNTIEPDGLFYGLLKPLLAAGPDVSMRRVFAFFSGGQFTGQERPDAIQAGSFGDWWIYLFQTFWGVPVLEHDPLFPWAYLLLFLLCLLALPGLWWLWRAAAGPTRLSLALLGLIVLLLFPFPILRFFLTHNILETGQGRHILYPAAQAIPILLVFGWAADLYKLENRRLKIKDRKWRIENSLPLPSSILYPPSSILYLLFTMPALLLTWSLFQLAYMTAVYPDPLPVRTTTFNPASIPQPLKHRISETIEFLGYDFMPDSAQSIINLTLYWRALGQVEENYRTQVQLVDQAGQPRFTWLSHPLNGHYPTRAWDKSDVIRDTLPLPLAAMPPGVYSIRLNLLREAEDTPLAAEPLEIMQFTLPNRPAIANSSLISDTLQYRLWTNPDSPTYPFSLPEARYRQTIPLSWANIGQLSTADLQPPTFSLVGPDNTPRSPAAVGDSTAIFIVEADWPSGDYRLQTEAAEQTFQTGPVLTVANEVRQFTLDPLPPGFIPVEANFADQVKLLGYTLPTRRVEPGGGLPLTLYWQSLTPALGNYVVFDKLLDEKLQVYGGYDRLPREYYSTILWANGEVVEDGFAVPVLPTAPPGIYNLHVGLYKPTNGQPVSLPLVQNGQTTEATSVVIGPLKVGGPPPGLTITAPQPQIDLNQSFGQQITLLGYNVSAVGGQPPTVTMTLYWRADAAPATDYTTFFHLRDAANQTVAQKDNPPADGRYPTGLWAPGEIIADEITLSLDNLPPGRYTPVVGLYHPVTGQRLLTPGHPANEVALEPLEIGESANGE